MSLNNWVITICLIKHNDLLSLEAIALYNLFLSMTFDFDYRLINFDVKNLSFLIVFVFIKLD